MYNLIFEISYKLHKWFDFRFRKAWYNGKIDYFTDRYAKEQRKLTEGRGEE